MPTIDARQTLMPLGPQYGRVLNDLVAVAVFNDLIVKGAVTDEVIDLFLGLPTVYNVSTRRQRYTRGGSHV